jgi:hypothetical protein
MGKVAKILTKDKPNKKPVKVAVQSPYKIIIVVNDNNRAFDTHAGLIMVSPTTFQIYDPNGSFTLLDIGGGSLNLFPVDGLQNQRNAYEAYIRFQLIDGANVYTYKFNVSKQNFDAIETRILEETYGGILYCSTCVSSAVAGIGPFKTLESGIFLPSNLKKAMDKLAMPVRMVEAR